MSIALYGVQIMHQTWCTMCMVTSIGQYYSEPKYRLYYQIPHALTLGSYLLLNRRCVFLTMERNLGNTQILRNVDEHDKVYVATILGFTSFWITTEYCRRINNIDKAGIISMSTLFGFYLYNKLFY